MLKVFCLQLRKKTHTNNTVHQISFRSHYDYVFTVGAKNRQINDKIKTGNKKNLLAQKSDKNV